MDAYHYSPKKRARINAPDIFETPRIRKDQKPTVEVIPNECIFEIFRRLSCGKERSSFMSSFCRAEIYKSEDVTEGSASYDDEIALVDEDLVIEDDGYLSQCLGGKKATYVRLAAIAVGTSARGGLGKLSIRGSNSARGVTDVGLSAWLPFS
ncbi:hypothetical protein LR48_Vigan10g180400 [Vigna angularis]|uniref:F-box domain-containing protein n=1 Tax=Phaseolus angularis TaxID=3914 RepID=A0A0L9VLY6_PHAAN|nr:hypothetical protein LR48_Vigan10g180400 [Vigna angularis]